MSSRQAVAFMVLALLSLPAAAADPPQKILLIGQGPDGHPAGSHEFMDGLKVLEDLLRPVRGLEVKAVKAEGAWPEGPDLIGRSDGVVLFLSEGAKWVSADSKRQQALAQLAARKGGLVALHWSIGCKEAGPIEPFLKLLGGCHGGPDRKYAVLETEAKPATPRHPIAAGVEPVRVKDEFYYRLKFVKPEGSVKPVLTAAIDGQDYPVAWAWERPDGGRSFGFSGLHYHDNWKVPAYRKLVKQGILWSVKMLE